MKRETPVLPIPVEEFASRLLNWYAQNKRDLPWREHHDPYQVWVSEIMLQQTRVSTVIPYYKSFIEQFPDTSALAASDSGAVLKAWEGLGYYARARNLHRAAREVTERFGGEVPSEPSVFRELPGVGEYVCAAVGSIAFGAPLAAVDGNVRRVLARLFALDSPVNRSSSQRLFQEQADRLLDPSRPGDFNQAMMELGATVCTPRNPSCTACPISEFCAAKVLDRVSEFPVREKRKPVPHYHVAVGVVEDGDRMLITRRPPSGLLGGLWEFPGGKVRDGETAEQACQREIAEEVSLSVEVGDFVGRVRHAYTHFKVEMDVFRCRYAGGEIELNGPTDFRWVVHEELEEYAFPRANHKFIPLLRDGGDES
jgi:A/G-specific adenine glycosylase